jgi:hypothetical protein
MPVLGGFIVTCIYHSYPWIDWNGACNILYFAVLGDHRDFIFSLIELLRYTINSVTIISYPFIFRCSELSLQKYSTTLTEDEDKLKSPLLSTRQKYSLYTAYGQKQILQKLIDSCRWLSTWNKKKKNGKESLVFIWFNNIFFQASSCFSTQGSLVWSQIRSLPCFFIRHQYWLVPGSKTWKWLMYVAVWPYSCPSFINLNISILLFQVICIDIYTHDKNFDW